MAFVNDLLYQTSLAGLGQDSSVITFGTSLDLSLNFSLRVSVVIDFSILNGL